MDCERIQQALSARLDGEDPGVGIGDDVIDAHVGACPQCEHFIDTAALVTRSLRVATAHPIDEVSSPDLSAVILARADESFRRTTARRALSAALVRVALVVIGVAWLALGVAMVKYSTLVAEGSAFVTSPSQGHAAPEVTAFDDPVIRSLVITAAAMRLALAAGAFLAAKWPILAAGMFPIYCAIAAFTAGFSTRGIILGAVTARDSVELVLLIVSAGVMAWAWIRHQGQLAPVARAWRAVTAQPG